MSKTLHITVVDKIATYRQRDGVIVCGNNDYVIEFAFDAEWDEHSVKTARFITNGTYTDVVFEGTSVTIPVITNTASVSVGVFAGDLRTTTPAVIECQKSILCDGGVPTEPTPDVYNQIMDMLNNGSGGGGGASWPTPEIVTAETRITEAGYYYAYAGFSGMGTASYTFGPFYCDPTKTYTTSPIVFVYSGYLARLTISKDGEITLQTGNLVVNGTMASVSYANAGSMYQVRLAKLS